MLEHATKLAANLHWLTFILTGRPGLSVDVTLDALDFDDGRNAFFSSWMLAWSRRVAMAKALAAIREEVTASARRTACTAINNPGLPPRNWALDRGATKTHLQNALLAIDVFPRCALLLRVFEGLSLADTAILLEADPDLILKAQVIGLRELTGNLALIQGRTDSAGSLNVGSREMQNA